MALIAVPLNLFAQTTVEIDGINYTLSGEKATVTSKDDGYTGDIVIPESVTFLDKSYGVVTVGIEAFQNCKLGVVTLPISITKISARAFYYSSVSSIVLMGCNTIGDYAFAGCSQLQSVIFNDTLTFIGDYAFSGCSELKTIELPDGVSYIGKSAFSGCCNLNSISIPETLDKIRSYTFESCTGLTQVNIPQTIESISDHAFMNCTGLHEVEIPNSVISLGVGIFKGCSNLISISLPESITEIPTGTFENCANLPSIKIPNTVSSIGSYAFSGCSKITLPSLPSSLTSISSYAFSNCVNLTSINLPNFITSIGDHAFDGCTGIKSVCIPNSVTYLGDYAFYNCRSMTNIKQSESLTEIGALTFAGCSELRTVILPSSIKSLGVKSFSNCAKLRYLVVFNSELSYNTTSFENTEIELVAAPTGFIFNGRVCYFNPDISEVFEDGTIITENSRKLLVVSPKDLNTDYSIPNGVEIISQSGFYVTGNLKSLTIPASLKSIEADAFKNVAIGQVNFLDWSKWYTDVELGNFYSNPYWNSTPYAGGVKITTPELKEGMTEIPDYKNYGLSFRDEIELSTTIKRIGAYAFYNNKELYNVILPEGLEEIGNSAFAGCDLLENPAFPDGLQKIEDSAFSNCTKLTEVVLPTGLSYLGNLVSDAAKGIFEGCTALEKAQIVCDIDYISANLFKDCTKLQSLFLPLQLKTIGDYSFYNTGLDEISFPATLESIGKYSFANGGISHVTIPNSVNSLGEGAFNNQSLRSLKIGSGLKSIPAKTFSGNNLTQITFSEGLEEICENAFSSGKGIISSVNLPTTVTTLGKNAFGRTSICEMTVPDKVIALTTGSCGNPSVLNLGTNIKEIAADAFSFDKLYTIRLGATTPPTLSDAFPLTTEQNDQLTLIVNAGRKPYYVTNARWKQIDRIIEDGDSEAVIYMTGEYSLSSEIRTTTGLMPAAVTKMTVTGPLTENDLTIIQQNMPALTSLDMRGVTNVTVIPDNLFNGSLITEIVLPEGLERIGYRSFANCRLLQIAELPSSLKYIGNDAFSGSVRVQLASFPEELTSIGSSAFANTSMQEFVAPRALTSLGSSAFSECKLLERVDLSSSALTSIGNSAFSGCSELDEVILPESIKSIGREVFKGTALRTIDFCNAVTSIGSGTFSNNRRLVAAALPKNLSVVQESMFSNCPRLIAVSMPTTTTSVGTTILSGDSKLSNISCAAVTAPTTVQGTFSGLRMRYVSLIVPRQSYRSYLDAIGWGSFETIKNTIPVEIDEGVDASIVSEDEYQDMLAQDALEQAEEEAAKEDTPTAEVRVARRAKARAHTPQYFASLFDGAQIQTGDEDSGIRVFINPKEDVNVTSVLFNDEELLAEYQLNHSVLLPQGSKGSLKIRTDGGTLTFLEAITAEGAVNISVINGSILISAAENAIVEVYSMAGNLVMRTNEHKIEGLMSGLYIVRVEGRAFKVVI